MSLDLVEIALDRFTDWVRFEKLASEIMRDEGYPDIRPLGGIHDIGQDAVVERFFSSKGKRIHVVFQFTLRADVAAKVQETIKRLDDGGIPFQKLIIVTSAQISAERQQAVKKQVKLENQVDLEIYERKTLVNRLADFGNGIFQRYFPDIREQVNRILESRPGVVEAKEEREKEFLKVSYAFTFAPEATRTRKSLIDETVLAVLSLHSPASLTPEGVIHAAKEALSAEVLGDLHQVEASLGRLKKRGSLEQKVDGFCLSAAERIRLEAAQASLNASQRSVVSDIVAEVCSVAAEPIPDTVRDRLHENARDVLVEYFRMNGLELAQSFLSEEKPVLVYFQGTPRLLDIATRHVPSYLGELLAGAIGKALCTPTQDQAQYFANCSRAYIGLQVMNIDPSLREFQISKFSAKVFVLDTDVVLGAIIEDLPVSGTYRNLISQLITTGASIVIPDEVLEEVSTHVAISPKTYDHFGPGLAGLNEELASTRIGNLVVRGYWYRNRERGRTSREDFMLYRDNYFDELDPRSFVADVVRDTLPGVKTGAIASFLQVTPAETEVERVWSIMLELAGKAVSSQYRTEEQTRKLADHDTQLMLAVTEYNKSAGSSARAVLGAKAYILTSSGRYLRAVEKLKVDVWFSTTPHILMALLEMIGPSRLNDREFVRLFENSVLRHSVGACWAGVKVLLDAGIELNDKSITRLRYDVEKRLHAQILSLQQADSVAGEEEDAEPEAGDREHIALLDQAEKLGYRPTRLLAKLREEKELNESEITRLAVENKELREAVTRFGKKKVRWLRRLDRVKGRQ